MLCENCGKRLKEGEKFCTVCGYYNNFLDEDEEIEEYVEDDSDEGFDSVEEIEIDEDESYENFKAKDKSKSKKEQYNRPNSKIKTFQDDRLVESFVGEDYKWIIQRPINIYAMLLSWIYFLYRKMYVIGIIGLAIGGVIIRLYPKALVFYIVISMIGSGIIFNPIYRKVVEFRIRLIRNKNQETDDFTLEKICQKKGGVNVSMALIIFLCFLLVMIRTYYRFTYNNENKKYWEENSENKANCKSVAQQDYKILDDYPVSGTLSSAACTIKKSGSTKKYDVYLRIKQDSRFIYIYFKDEKDSISVEGVDIDYSLIEEVKKHKEISENDQKVIDRLDAIRKEYTNIENRSKEEDELIKRRKNNEEKLNYILDKDDILK